MVSEEFAEQVLAIVERIPPGRVMTYGDIGVAVGVEAPRAVGRVMALYGHASPWWRVVPASGHPPQGHARLALPHYLEEGTPLRRVNLPKGAEPRDASISSDVDDYRIALSAARLPHTHEVYSEVAL